MWMFLIASILILNCEIALTRLSCWHRWYATLSSEWQSEQTNTSIEMYDYMYCVYAYTCTTVHTPTMYRFTHLYEYALLIHQMWMIPLKRPSHINFGHENASQATAWFNYGVCYLSIKHVHPCLWTPGTSTLLSSGTGIPLSVYYVQDLPYIGFLYVCIPELYSGFSLFCQLASCWDFKNWLYSFWSR